jgi:hypothetical protein
MAMEGQGRDADIPALTLCPGPGWRGLLRYTLSALTVTSFAEKRGIALGHRRAHRPTAIAADPVPPPGCGSYGHTASCTVLRTSRQ